VRSLAAIGISAMAAAAGKSSSAAEETVAAAAGPARGRRGARPAGRRPGRRLRAHGRRARRHVRAPLEPCRSRPAVLLPRRQSRAGGSSSPSTKLHPPPVLLLRGDGGDRCPCTASLVCYYDILFTSVFFSCLLNLYKLDICCRQHFVICAC